MYVLLYSPIDLYFGLKTDGYSTQFIFHLSISGGFVAGDSYFEFVAWWIFTTQPFLATYRTSLLAIATKLTIFRSLPVTQSRVTKLHKQSVLLFVRLTNHLALSSFTKPFSYFVRIGAIDFFPARSVLVCE
jgi:hypothetical protein